MAPKQVVNLPVPAVLIRQPYVGITGFSRRQEIVEVVSSVGEELFFVSGRKLMAGVLVGKKTLAGMRSLKYPNRFPVLEDLESIFLRHEHILNFVHYCADNDSDLFFNLSQLVQIFRGKLHGFQVNLPWPNRFDLQSLKNAYPDLKLVLQVGTEALRQICFDPNEFVLKIHEYKGIVDYVLYDPSGGTGKGLSPQSVCKYFRKLKRSGLGLVAAGGLSPKIEELTSKLAPLYEEFPGLSTDIESGVRYPGTDKFDVDAAIAYVRGCLEICKAPMRQ